GEAERGQPLTLLSRSGLSLHQQVAPALRDDAAGQQRVHLVFSRVLAVEKCVGFQHAPLRMRPVQKLEASSSLDVAFFEDSAIPAGQPRLLHSSLKILALPPSRQPPARRPRLRHLENGFADRDDVSHTTLALELSPRREVLTQGSINQFREIQLGLPE